ncbi:uncharacterized protein FOMMEDRAFT_133444 [Fomitiporia mediterranea MF3/22]|uniref:uncharacterized protein n=1 Tax=Fomitiporia mediterranea (strain MF3/22) TaxID=694068 RepID=UPI0004407F95|nr:uncharacterized protein FOMMEDRAFT_133444 [Fomitiporia mediterranea MF3/22]EJD04096.1 hypothetical protein FOMMEDRAFT_133444 [Fomitiporia mediterranea MF3/22]
MFPPMDRLTAISRSLVDLETNSSIPPTWENRTSILGGISNTAISITGSSVVASFYSLHSLIDVAQIFALICSSIIPLSSMDQIKDDWKKLFLGVIPNILALNFGATVVQSSIVLGIIISATMVLLYFFWSMTNRLEDLDAQEGFPTVQPKGSGWGLILVCFMLTVLYLPLSTIVTHALVWSDDFWVVANPYINATTNPPSLPPLGPSDEFRDPLDFCYTTTMKRNEVNLAPIIVIVSGVAFLTVRELPTATCLIIIPPQMTIWYPLQLRRVIMQAVPKVDRFTERGTPRSSSELDRAYQRLIQRDQHPMTFLYSDFRRGWGTYKSIYLLAKLSALIIISVISPDNCLFRTLSRIYVSITRQAVLSAVMLIFFLIQCFRAPFIDPVNNASEWTSRLSYLLTSLVGLAIAIDESEADILNGPVLYIIYILTYGFAVYFTIIDFNWMQRIVKRITGRMDFSIDVFSPRLDLSPSSPHVKRRTWQETITTLFLTSPECQIPKDQAMRYASAREIEYPPYLLGFEGSPAERHVENLKILREVGLKGYLRGCKDLKDHALLHSLQEWIQREFTGPDMLWLAPDKTEQPQARFGTSWWIPFPPTLVFRYDDGGTAVLNLKEQFDVYLSLNQSKDAQRKRQLRLALRALDGQIPVGNHNQLCCFGRRYRARGIMDLHRGVFRIQRKGRLMWKGIDLGSGFDIELAYSKDIQMSGDALGYSNDCDLTPSLARFLTLNQALVVERLPIIEWTMGDFRKHYRRECRYKAQVLSYEFLTTVHDTPQGHEEFVRHVAEQEADLRVRQLILGATDAFLAGHERFERAVSSPAAAWWYVFWDDVWRRNHDTIGNMSLHEQDFNPFYPTSIAYTPLPRPALEAFLRQRGLYGKSTFNAFFHPGLLNKIYFWLSQIVFPNSSRAVLLHLGEGPSEINISAIDTPSHARSSSLGTGGGTDYDDSYIRARPNYRWEGLLEDPIRSRRRRSGWLAKLGVWLGVTPLWRSGMMTRGLALDVKLENGRYVLISKDNV